MNNFFSHDSNARNSDKLIPLRASMGAEGYGIYFMILERLREEPNYTSVKDYNMLAFDLRVDAAKVKKVIENFGLFVFTDDGKYFYSEGFMRRMQIKDNQSEKAREAAKIRWRKEKGMQAQCERNADAMRTQCKERKEKESKEKKRKEDKRKTSSSTTAACEAECPETAQVDMPNAEAIGSKSECLTPEKSSAKKVPPTPEAGIIPIGEVAEWMKSNVVWLEAFCMNNHLDMKYVEGRIDDFVRECENNGETGKDSHDCMRHFNYWLRKTRRQAETAVTHARSTGRHPATNFNNDKHYDDF